MSAVPLPKPEPEPAPDAAPDADGWALLEALRRRLDDHGAQGRKTQVQVTQLAESIGALVAEQRRRSRWANMNSFVAYVLFTLLVGSGFYLLYRSRAHELVDARDTAQRERDTAVKRSDELTAKVTARDAADGKAWDIYQLLEAGKNTEAAAKLGALGDLPLSRTERAVLAARAHETQVMEVDAALKAAAVAFRGGRYADVIAPLEAALVSEPAGARASTMRYYLGVAYAKGNDLDKAMQLLGAAVAADVDQEDARFQLASALDRAGQYAKARAEYDRFATAHPQSGLAVFAMRRSATLARMPAVAPQIATPPAGAVTSPAVKTPAQAIAPAQATPPAAPAAAPKIAPAAVKAPPTAPAKAAPAPAKQPAPAKIAPAPAKQPAKQTPAPATTPPPEADPTAAEVQSTATTNAAPMLGGTNLDVVPMKATKPAPKHDEEAPKKPEPAPAPKQEPKVPPPPSAAPPSEVPQFPIDRTPAPSPLGPPVDKEPAPSLPNIPRDEPRPPPIRFDAEPMASPSDPKPAPAKPAPAPARDPKPAPPTDTKLPPPPSAAPPSDVPQFPIERTPAPSPLGPPVDKDPAPAPRTPPRDEPRPPPIRFDTDARL